MNTSYMTEQSLVGHQIGSYLVQEWVGQGSYGMVYKVRSKEDGSCRAMKFLKLGSVPTSHRSNFEERFRMEYETGKIQSPNLVQSYLYGIYEQNPYFVMDYCPNGNLRQRMMKGLNLEEVIQIAMDILRGLDALHRAGKVHRDLKPENVLFGQYGQAQLADFGIAGHINVQLTQVGVDSKPDVILGNYIYMAPEQLHPATRQDTLLFRIDWFAFGVLCYEMFTGCLPFGPWETMSDLPSYLDRAARGAYVPIQEVNPEVPDVWARAIHACLCADPHYRPQNASELYQLLQLPLPTDVGKAGFYAALEVLQGEQHGEVFRLPDLLQAATGSLILIGRTSPGFLNHISLLEQHLSFISRKHASLEWHESTSSWELRDGQFDRQGSTFAWKLSKNGTYVNGKRVPDARSHTLRWGDVITLGNTTLKVCKTTS
jgi:serine/threonine protein kinase